MALRVAVAAVVAAVSVLSTTTSPLAKSLSDILVPPSVEGTFLEGGIPTGAIGSAIGTQVANQIPTLSTSAGYTYEWNPDLEVLERSAKTFGPLFTERALTVGRNKFNFNLSYSWIRFDEYGGKNLDRITNRVEVARVPETGQVQFFGPSRPGDIRGDGTTQLFGDQLQLHLDLETQVWDLSFTYGVLDDLDVNVDIPVLYTYLRSGLTETLPDPRCLGVSQDCDDLFTSGLGDQIGVDADGNPGSFFVLGESANRGHKLGIGDMHLRTKYAPFHDPINIAALLDLSLPTGKKENFQGTGDTRLLTSLIASEDIGPYVELHTQGGVQFNINTLDRSQAKYAAGVTVQPLAAIALTVDFIGRSEFGAQGRIPNTGRLPAVRNVNGEPTLAQPLSEIDGLDDDGNPVNEDGNFKGRPIFLDIERNDVLDLSVGARFEVGAAGIAFVNFLVPLNEDGLRADFIPTIGFEKTF